MITVQGVHHVKLPVSDLTRSRGWYESVLGVRPWLEFADGSGVIRGVAYHPLGTLTLCLREDPPRASAFAGFDPLAILVATRADLDEVTAHLDHLGIPHGPVTTATLGWLLSTTDPDGVDLRFYTAEHHSLGAVSGGGITAGAALATSARLAVLSEAPRPKQS
jgi:catechol 2,3-dioxygenase-like lactoylglutathione lyase family enzyme